MREIRLIAILDGDWLAGLGLLCYYAKRRSFRRLAICESVSWPFSGSFFDLFELYLQVSLLQTIGRLYVPSRLAATPLSSLEALVLLRPLQGQAPSLLS